MTPATESATTFVERLEQDVSRLEALFAQSADAPDGPWVGEMKRFARFAGSVTPAAWQQIVEEWPAVLDFRSRLHPMYGHYLRLRELAEAPTVLGRMAPGLAVPPSDVSHGFARDAYDRVRDMFIQVDFRVCRRFVMVGCGPLPVTILHVADLTEVPELIGLDIDEGALRIARQLLARLGLERVRVIKRDGLSHDFADADVVYVANMASPKAAVLERVADTAREGTQVVVRDPVGMGNLLAENSADRLDPRFRLVGEGQSAIQFLSHDRYLRLQGVRPASVQAAPSD